MKIYVINLKRRPDRLKQIQEKLPEEWKPHVEYTTEWPGIVDGNRIQSEDDLRAAGVTLYKHWKIPDASFKFWRRQMTKGEIGCSFSHYSVWRRAQQEFQNNPDLGWVLILEDDTYFAKDADAKIKKLVKQDLPSNWDLCYLGRVLQEGECDYYISDQVVRPGFSFCTYGYILSRKGVERLLSTDFLDSLIPVDEFITACYMTHKRVDVATLFPPIIQAYAARPNMVFQLTKCDGGSDTENSAIFN